MDLVEISTGTTRRHPWEEARFRFFARLLEDTGVLGRDQRVLDVGAGDAWFAHQLARRISGSPRIDCWDAGYADTASITAGDHDGLTLMRHRPVGSYPLVLLLDVAEHVPDDRRFLIDLVRDHVDTGGHILISVPAWPSLFTPHDTSLGHHRRYTPKAAAALVERVGLTIVRSGGLFHALVPLRAAHAAVERLTRRRRAIRNLGQWDSTGPVTALTGAMLAVDNALSRAASRLGWNLPGLSWWALCRK